jgi:DNA-binding beta-propeller fold protein YncE
MKSTLLKNCTVAVLGAALLLSLGANAEENKTQENPFRPRNRQLLYVTLPGTLEAAGWRNGLGIVVLDVNDDYRFVKRIPTIDIPASMSPEQVAGVAASPATNMIYLAYRGRLAAFDLATEKLVWVQTYDGKCCERPEITSDGGTIVVGSDLQDYWYVVDAATGKLKGTIKAPNSMNAHNLNLSPDGKLAFMSPNGPVLAVGDVQTMKLVKEIRFTDNVRPFVVNHDASKIYANVNNLLGFEIADVNTRQVIKRVEVTSFPWKEAMSNPRVKVPHGCPSHGIALVNDEREVWIVDGINNYVHIFDNTQETPSLIDSVKTGHGPAWITIGLGGKYAYVSSGDVIDTQTRHVVAQMKDEFGRVMLSEKLLDMTFRDGKLQRVASQFGNGQVLNRAGQ